jgi:hypothetical protein
MIRQGRVPAIERGERERRLLALLELDDAGLLERIQGA